MSRWTLSGINAAGEDAYDVRFASADDERTFRFTAHYRGTGEKRLTALKTGDFERETLYSRDMARAAVDAVFAFHEAVSAPVLFALPGEPPER
jgi:hypothetical protein